MVLMPAVAVWAVIPFQAEVVMADVNAGLLYVMAISSVGVYGVILAGWASNSKYAFIGAMRAAAQMVSYEIAMGFALVTVLMVAGSLNLSAVDFHRHISRFWQFDNQGSAARLQLENDDTGENGSGKQQSDEN